MKGKIIIISLLIITNSILRANDNSDTKILKTKSSFYPHVSLTCGIQNSFASSRINLKYYHNTMNYAVRYTDYDIFFIGTKPYQKDVTMSHKELSLTLNKVFYSPYSNIHCSLGSGLLYRMRNLRDEMISYENWTEKKNNDIGMPIELNLENFLIPTHIVINFGYKVIIYKEEFHHSIFFDFGFWFWERGKTK